MRVCVCVCVGVCVGLWDLYYVREHWWEGVGVCVCACGYFVCVCVKALVPISRGRAGQDKFIKFELSHKLCCLWSISGLISSDFWQHMELLSDVR